LLSKWTATEPRNREKHFMVVRIVTPQPPAGAIQCAQIQAVYSGRSQVLA
jgi:tryptophan-rich hypothetical protein